MRWNDEVLPGIWESFWCDWSHLTRHRKYWYVQEIEYEIGGSWGMASIDMMKPPMIPGHKGARDMPGQAWQ